MIECEIEAPGPQGPLKGTFLLPAECAPVVLIIPGSGPTDRDGNNRLGIRAATYRLLAEGLVERRIGSLRIDKRGMFGSQAAVPDANDVTLAEYTRDVGAWVQTLRERTEVPRIWLLGHSEGGLVALHAAARERDLCGLVLVATAGRPISQILMEQLRANPANAPILTEAETAVEALEAGRTVDPETLHPALRPLFAAKVQRFLGELARLDPPRMLADYSGPTLILQGERDLQIAVEDARLLAAAPRSRLVLLPDANHVLKSVEEASRDANLATYARPDLPLAPGVVDTIAAFVGTAA